MEGWWFASASGFALVSSISPGPVNLLSLSHAMRGELRACVHFISGATLGFTAQLLLLGLVMQPLLAALPWLSWVLHWGGVAFFVWMAWLLWQADAADAEMASKPIGFGFGALLQWLNPKAYLAIAAAVGLYVGDSLPRLLALAMIYVVWCWLSLAAWVALGIFLRRHMPSSHRMVYFNRALALLLLASLVMMWR